MIQMDPWIGKLEYGPNLKTNNLADEVIDLVVDDVVDTTNDEAANLREYLTSKGVKFDKRIGIKKLRKLKDEITGA